MKKRKSDSSEPYNPKNARRRNSFRLNVVNASVIVALLGLIGVILTAYFNYKGQIVDVNVRIHATLTAEAKLTELAAILTPTATLEAFTSTPTTSATPTFVPSSTPSPSSTQTATPPPISYCQFNGLGGVETVPVNPPRVLKGILIDLKTRHAFDNGMKYGFSLWEVVIANPDTAGNLSIGAIASASSEQNDAGCMNCLAIKAIDGDNDSRWSSEFYEPQWLRIVFSSPQVIHSIILKWQDAYAEAYCITEVK
jgi:F5/8 type C domain